ncbi:uncharacterized protein LOC123429922 [Hordeum vulgare subsp. vulgare]|uniref:uncharacterized protein LOC123429922 n=1 Tax=Hordeum vulgare subsp. vulgare TaxID=112509 RepID=UPI001D1A4D8B|nr:uncharacterized protein LOC123429922 [Hordeum vulgare subsp. vulgare]
MELGAGPCRRRRQAEGRCAGPRRQGRGGMARGRRRIRRRGGRGGVRAQEDAPQRGSRSRRVPRPGRRAPAYELRPPVQRRPRAGAAADLRAFREGDALLLAARPALDGPPRRVPGLARRREDGGQARAPLPLLQLHIWRRREPLVSSLKVVDCIICGDPDSIGSHSLSSFVKRVLELHLTCEHHRLVLLDNVRTTNFHLRARPVERLHASSFVFGMITRVAARQGRSIWLTCATVRKERFCFSPTISIRPI